MDFRGVEAGMVVFGGCQFLGFTKRPFEFYWYFFLSFWKANPSMFVLARP